MPTKDFNREIAMEKRIGDWFTPDTLSGTDVGGGLEPTEGKGRILCHSGHSPVMAFRGDRGRDAWKTGWSDALSASHRFQRIQEWLP